MGRPRIPNFFIAGAPNTGTTSLYHYLRQHPQVYMSADKEPTYFGAAEFLAAPPRRDLPSRARERTVLERLMVGAPKPLSWDAYLALFRDARDEPAVGEASVRYLLLPDAPRAIAARVPHARLIFILRDPAEWQFTRYLAMAWREPQGSFRQWFAAATKPGAMWAQPITVGRYATHLQRFFDLFPREQLLIHLHEDYKADGRGIVRETLRFLEVDPDYPIDMSRRHFETTVPRFPMLETLRRRMFGDAPLGRWFPSFAHRMLRSPFYRRRPELTTMDPADRALVIDYYRDEIQRTGTLIGRDLSAWLR